ncbi:calycin-like domain-containing protein [Prevotella multiformis]|uniref:calycin-like domain-containing protein n=1 Tax=Prevotella multiformis TaxID=282402 RepID=UPI003F9ED24E
MKKFFTLAIVSLLSTAAVQAQKVVINKADGTQVTFQASEITNVQFAPASLTDNFAGSYKGEDKISVGGIATYTSSEAVTYKVISNEDGTVNLTVPEETFKKTVMGNLTLSSYTISKIPYDESKKAFIKAYKDDNIKFHFIIKNDNGTVISDKEYTFDSRICKVIITKGADGKLTVSNTYQMGKMPFPISGTFTGTKQ